MGSSGWLEQRKNTLACIRCLRTLQRAGRQKCSGRNKWLWDIREFVSTQPWEGFARALHERMGVLHRRGWCCLPRRKRRAKVGCVPSGLQNAAPRHAGGRSAACPNSQHWPQGRCQCLAAAQGGAPLYNGLQHAAGQNCVEASSPTPVPATPPLWPITSGGWGQGWGRGGRPP